MGGGIELPGGTETPGVEGLPQGDETSVVTPKGDGVPGGVETGRGGEPPPPQPPRRLQVPGLSRAKQLRSVDQGRRRSRVNRRKGSRKAGKQESSGCRQHLWCQAQERHDLQVRLTGANRDDGGSNRRGDPVEWRRTCGDIDSGDRYGSVLQTVHAPRV